MMFLTIINKLSKIKGVFTEIERQRGPIPKSDEKKLVQLLGSRLCILPTVFNLPKITFGEIMILIFFQSRAG